MSCEGYYIMHNYKRKTNYEIIEDLLGKDVKVVVSGLRRKNFEIYEGKLISIANPTAIVLQDENNSTIINLRYVCAIKVK